MIERGWRVRGSSELPTRPILREKREGKKGKSTDGGRSGGGRSGGELAGPLTVP